MRVLVTGHLGYIGTVMTPLLLKEGHEVVGMDSDLYSRCTFGAGMVNVPNIKKDIRHVEPADLKGFEAVLHLAALVGDDDRQTLFRDRGRGFLLALTKEIENVH